jgi:hypothetical protein
MTQCSKATTLAKNARKIHSLIQKPNAASSSFSLLHMLQSHAASADQQVAAAMAVADINQVTVLPKVTNIWLQKFAIKNMCYLRI